MKLSKLLLSSTLAAALVLGFAGCSSDESGDSSIIKLDGRNATTYDDEAGTTLVSNNGDTFRRGYKTVKGTNWKGALYVLSIDTTEQTGSGGVLGVTFDGYEKDGTNNMYVLGMRYREDKTQIYLSYFEGVSSEQLESNNATSSFGTAEYQLINGGSDSAFQTLKDVKKDDNGKVTITVLVYQNSENSKYNGKYGIAIYAGDKSEEFADVNVENISLQKPNATLPKGKINLTIATTAYDNGNLFKKYSDVTSTDTLESFGVMKNNKGETLAKGKAAEGKFGFYVNIYPKTNSASSTLDGSWKSLDADLEAEIIEE